jgi:diguanylate cyclase (GGDEF)-like protein
MRVDYSRATREELIAIIEMQERWHLAARFDPVTGVMNREGILGRLRVEMSRTDREGRPLGVGLVDIDDFRGLARNRGQACAAAVLSAAAGRIGGVLRVYDRVGRVGGDEFLILAPGAGTADLQALLRRVRFAVSRDPVLWKGEKLTVGVRAGALAYRGGLSSERLLSAVQGALLRESPGGTPGMDAPGEEPA